MRMIQYSGCGQWIPIEFLAKRQVPYNDPISGETYWVYECPSDHTELIREYLGRVQ